MVPLHRWRFSRSRAMQPSAAPTSLRLCPAPVVPTAYVPAVYAPAAYAPAPVAPTAYRPCGLCPRGLCPGTCMRRWPDRPCDLCIRGLCTSTRRAGCLCPRGLCPGPRGPGGSRCTSTSSPLAPSTHRPRAGARHSRFFIQGNGSIHRLECRCTPPIGSPGRRSGSAASPGRSSVCFLATPARIC